MMKNAIRYDKKTIEKARRLFKKAVPLREIMRRTGIKSTSTIQFRFDPKYRKKHALRGMKWRKKNPERWSEINRRAVARYNQKKRG
ncbi:MAG TPA: hypothetical protein PKG74_03060 [Candidatus Colwellbacteria bacterium]|nr:hypothetical protein [Candidatus Colwellbacteria bacterium]